MVYCGKPSKGCALCRAKRTKCDQKRPSCSQCMRKQVECPGYRDEQALAFRDETDKLSRPRQSAVARRLRSITPNTGNADAVTDVIVAHVNDGSGALTHRHIPSALDVPVEDQATSFFFKQYIWEDKTFAKGSWNFLPKFYSEEQHGSAITECITALGLLGISNTKHVAAPDLASSKYAHALRAVNRALQDPIQAKTDQTLVAVELLSLYESFNCRNISSMRAWAKHIDGATALLRLRGRDQLNTRVGRRLYVQARAQILVSCTHRRKPAPEFIREWAALENEYDSPEELHATQLIYICVRVCNLQAELHSHPPPTIALREEARAKLERLDEEFLQWEAASPAIMGYQTVTTTRPSEFVYGDKYHVYTSIWIAMLWNYYRTMRILLKAMQWDCLEKLATTAKIPIHTSQWADAALESIKTMKEISREIAASMPYYLGVHQLPPDAPDQYIRMHGSCCMLLIWPLYSIGATNLDEAEILDWAVARLRQLTTDTGMMQGQAIANMLCQNRRLGVAEVETPGDGEQEGHLIQREIEQSEPGEAWET